MANGSNKKPQHPQEAGPYSDVKWDLREDAYKHAGEYPNQNYTRTQSGHTIMYDDTKDKEHLTIQHRSGSRMQFGPTGDIQFISHNGTYSVVFGENRMEVTGTHDITVKGGGTLKVDGDYDVTVGGDVNMAADGDFNWKGRNFNMLGSGNFDMEAKNLTFKTEGATAFHSQGSIGITAGTHASMVAQAGAVSVVAATTAGVYSHTGSVALQALGGNIEIYTPNMVNVDGDTAVWINSGMAAKATEITVWQPTKHPALPVRRGTPGRPTMPRHGSSYA